MARILLGALLFAICAGWPESEAAAQVSYDGCYVNGGYPVASIMAPNLQDVATAVVDPNAGPVIYYNPYVLAWLQPQTRVFFYYHECAHHVLGHTIGSTHPLFVEQQADCWAIRSLIGSGNFNQHDVAVVQGDLAAAGRGDWTHLPGPQRALKLALC
jgi:hypothetical protein